MNKNFYLFKYKIKKKKLQFKGYWCIYWEFKIENLKIVNKGCFYSAFLLSGAGVFTLWCWHFY